MTTINSADLQQIMTKIENIENIEREKVETSELLTDAYDDALAEERKNLRFTEVLFAFREFVKLTPIRKTIWERIKEKLRETNFLIFRR